MDRRMIYLFSLIAFFLMWGVFGFAAATPRSEPAVQATVAPVESTLVLPDSKLDPAIPVTGDRQAQAGMIAVYGLHGVAGAMLIWALFHTATRYARRKRPPDKS